MCESHFLNYLSSEKVIKMLMLRLKVDYIDFTAEEIKKISCSDSWLEDDDLGGDDGIIRLSLFEKR